MTENRLDEAIDRAVREMTNLEPAAGFSRRVRARLDARPASFVTFPRFAAAAALIATAIVTAWLVEQPRVGVDRRQAVELRGPQGGPQNPPPATRTPQETTSTPPESHGPTRARAASARQRIAVQELPPFVSSVAVKPLQSLAPIAVEPLTPDAIDASEVSVAPLEPLPPLRVDPLPSTPR